MKFIEFLNEKLMKDTMIGFGIDNSKISRLSDYFESWFIRNKIEYSKNKEYHISIAQITAKYQKDVLVRDVHEILNKSDFYFVFKDIKIFRGQRIPKDFIVIEFKANSEFINLFNSISQKYEVRTFGAIKPHCSLFTVEKDTLNDVLFNEMKYSMPKLSKLKPESVNLFNNKFEVEYEAG